MDSTLLTHMAKLKALPTNKKQKAASKGTKTPMKMAQKKLNTSTSKLHQSDASDDNTSSSDAKPPPPPKHLRHVKVQEITFSGHRESESVALNMFMQWQHTNIGKSMYVPTNSGQQHNYSLFQKHCPTLFFFFFWNARRELGMTKCWSYAIGLW